MGNEESSPIDESAPSRTLAGRTLDALAEYIKSGKAKKVVVMTGAGISTSAGIPDFRSPDTGLYANLARLNLPYAEAVFDISYFRKNPEPFYTLAHELYPGKYRPTITHSFIRLLHDKGMLLKHFTQNIDCLDREAGVPGDKIVEAHGSFARQSCIECSMPYPEDEIKKHIEAKSIPRCESCKGLVKPEIVFFGEQLPADFFKHRMLPAEADLVIVLGTSLTVQPFASLPSMIREHTPRLLINKERVGGIGSGSDDVLLIGDCDAGVRQLAEACGWLDELESLWAQTAPTTGGDAARPVQEAETEKGKDEALEDEIDKLTQEVDETLNLSKWHEERVRNEKLPRESSGVVNTTAKALGPSISKQYEELAKSQEPNGESSGPATSTESGTRSQHEDAKGNLNHVFVSKAQDPASSDTPVIPREGGGTDSDK
ncbi:Sir2 histone deacetylase Hst2 [Saxophila tyrrhenica]|uniref:Sir2 histone deacetylase Hst2 n=1 Tax=Saxophila tyrrhenica TaxID=1690608 RepID=A0AAV9P6Y9_9PEZI|nr:Sir2 histone deacetylase Hst2 [Saxophila tyrrhenica]